MYRPTGPDALRFLYVLPFEHSGNLPYISLSVYQILLTCSRQNALMYKLTETELYHILRRLRRSGDCAEASPFYTGGFDFYFARSSICPHMYRLLSRSKRYIIQSVLHTYCPPIWGATLRFASWKIYFLYAARTTARDSPQGLATLGYCTRCSGPRAIFPIGCRDGPAGGHVTPAPRGSRRDVPFFEKFYALISCRRLLF